MISYLWVSLGGALGSAARFWVSGFTADRFGAVFPLGTLLVNVSGSLAIGLLAGLTNAEGRFLVSPSFREFFMIGVCGGYTTFSSFSLQTFALVQNGEWMRAGINAVASFTLCLVAVWLGYFCTSLISKS